MNARDACAALARGATRVQIDLRHVVSLERNDETIRSNIKARLAGPGLVVHPEVLGFQWHALRDNDELGMPDYRFAHRSKSSGFTYLIFSERRLPKSWPPELGKLQELGAGVGWLESKKGTLVLSECEEGTQEII